MKRIQSILVLLAAFPGVFLPLACGSKDNETPLEQAEGGQGGTSGREASDRAAGEAQGKGEGGAGKDASFDPRMEEDEEPVDSPDTDPEETVSNDCDLENEDLPDDDFIDSNCDGIDGDVTRAVFVAPTGNDFARGTMDDPLRTIQAAVDSARELDQDVYVCNAKYEGALLIENDGVNLYGGYDCNNGWKRALDRAHLVSRNGPALTVQGVTGLKIERILFETSDTTAPETSTIAGTIVESHDVILRHLEFVAGRAGDGAEGEAGQAFLSPAPNGANGGAGCTTLDCTERGLGGALFTTHFCADAQFRNPGGRGGHGPSTYTAGTPGQKGYGDELGGQGGVISQKGADRNGADGKDGRKGAVGAHAVSSIGAFVGTQYDPSNRGAPGSLGQPAGAGGGGAGGHLQLLGDLCCTSGNGGAQGGHGGCGGYPGQGGDGGGGSFGLVLVNSEVALSRVRLLTSDGGAGGAGGRGGDGQLGGASGSAFLAGIGGKGGRGGAGGAGAPGGGGPSIGLALVSSSLAKSEHVQVLLGQAGRGGSGINQTDASDGVAAEGYDFTSRTTFTF